jgi:hypothetical protein
VLGKKFNRLKVVGVGKISTTPNGSILPYFWCLCDCGKKVEVLRYNLTAGKVKSCGCLRREMASVTKTNVYQDESFGLEDGHSVLIDKEDIPSINQIYWYLDKGSDRVRGVKSGVTYALKDLVTATTEDETLTAKFLDTDKMDHRKSNLCILDSKDKAVRYYYNYATSSWEGREFLTKRQKEIKAREIKRVWHKYLALKNAAKSKGGMLLTPEYRGAREKHMFKCGEGHIWESDASRMLNGLTWCDTCNREIQAIKRRVTEEELIKRAAKQDGVVVYDGFRKDGYYDWRCKEGHDFTMLHTNVTAGNWCGQCSKSKSENKVRSVLEDLFNVDFKSIRPEFLRPPKEIGKTLLELDGYNESLKLAFEHQGMQHYNNIPFFHRGGCSLEQLQKRDAYKVKRCKELGIILIVVPALNVLLKEKDLLSFIKTSLIGTRLEI